MTMESPTFSKGGGVALEAPHLEELRASDISPDVIGSRGYRSVTDPSQLPEEFKGAQRTLKGLLIPVRDVTGRIALHQLKPDEPRTDDKGRNRKYEWPAGVGLRLDVPEAALPFLRDATTPLWVTEGSKKVDSAVSHGIPSIIGLAGVWCWMSNGLALPDWHEITLDGRDVIIAFDSDVMTKANVRDAIDRLARYLELRGAHVRYCLLPPLPSGDKCGLDDWLAEGHSMDELMDLIVDTLLGPVAEWEDALAIPTFQGPAFPSDVFPHIVEQYVDAVAEETQTPRDLPAIVALGTLSAAVGGKFIVQPYPDKGWLEPVHLHAVAVAESGMRKSSVFSRMTAPVFAVERERQDEARLRIEEWESRDRALVNSLRSAEQAASKATPDGAKVTDEDAIRMAAVRDLMVHRNNRPVLPRLVLDDATPEVAVQHMSQQGGTIAVMSAEAAFLSNIAGQYSDRPKFDVLLKGFSGESLQTDRIGRESEHIPHACLTLCLSVQPKVIADLGKVPGFEDRGGVARLLAGFIPDERGFEDLDARSVPWSLETEWDRLVRKLLELPIERSDTGDRTRQTLHLSPDAQRVFRAFQEAHQHLMRPRGALREIDKWGARLPGQVLRIASLLHVATHDSPQAHLIEGASMNRAIKIGEYFAAHAFILHRHITGHGGYTDALDLLEVAREMGPIVPKREIHRRVRGQLRFRKADSLNAPLRVLEELHWIRRVETPGGGPGRPSEVYEINPAAHVDEMAKTWIPTLSLHSLHPMVVSQVGIPPFSSSPIDLGEHPRDPRARASGECCAMDSNPSIGSEQVTDDLGRFAEPVVD
jgi:replicative DNA helicase